MTSTAQRRFAVALCMTLFLLLVANAVKATAATRSQVKRIVCQVFGPQCGDAMAIIGCETGWTWNPKSVGRAGERGLMQIHPTHFGHVLRSGVGRIYVQPERLFEIRYNAKVGYVLSNGGRNWSAWTCA